MGFTFWPASSLWTPAVAISSPSLTPEAIAAVSLRQRAMMTGRSSTEPVALSTTQTAGRVPCWKIDVNEKMNSRRKLRQYCKNLLKFEPDYVFTHVTRLVPSKGLWRDLRVLEHLEQQLRARNETAVLFTLSTEVPARRSDDIRRMEQWHKWPVAHREGLPDLSNGEAAYYQGVQEFNAISRKVKVVFINQFA